MDVGLHEDEIEDIIEKQISRVKVNINRIHRKIKLFIFSILF